MLSPFAGAGAALDGRRLFDLADARKIVDARWKHDDEHFARALANAPRLEDVIPQAAGVDSAWRPVGTRTTLAAPSWDPSLRVPLTALDAAPPAEQETLRLGEGDERSPLLPSLFMPGFPKAATTFLYNCMLANFGPTHVGCGRSPAGWTAAACGRRFALTTLSSTSRGELSQWKEAFFYGGKPVEWLEGERDDLLGLHGPDPRRGSLASLPALWAWGAGGGSPPRHQLLPRIRTLCEEQPGPPEALPPEGLPVPLACAAAANGSAQAAALRCEQPRCSRMGVAACEGANHARARHNCAGQGQPQPHPAGSCSHPACVRIAKARAATSGMFTPKCSWNNVLQASNGGKTDSYCLHSMAPWATKGELNVSLVDFTPNYLCDANAMERIHRVAGSSARHLRFIVVMRDPVYRAFSEWSMFSLGWNWDPIKNFSGSMATQAQQLQRCNASLFMRPDALAKLPTAELATYINKCFGGGKAAYYATTSLYSVCLLHALRYFRREQFLLLRYEDLMRMDAASVLGLLARFTGLSPPARPTGSRMCQPNGKVSSGARNSYSGTSPRGAEMLNEAAPHLERLFAPYATLLRDLVHPDFGWRRSDHRKRPLNATMRAQREAEVEGYREHLRNRQANRMMHERSARAAIVGAGKARGSAAGGGRKGKGKGRGKGKGKKHFSQS